MKLLYAISIRLYGFAIGVVSLWNPKAKQWIVGRKNWQKKLNQALGDKKNIHWFHCASLGEFEQARPLIERIKTESPSTPILVSFFSPSGYEQRKDYELATYVCYLPLDTKKNAQQFVATLHFAKAFFVKYEVWPNYFAQLASKKIPFYLISATFRPSQLYFKPAGKWFKKLLTLPNQLFVQNEDSQLLLNSHKIDSILAGDTRYDRVLATAQKAVPNEIIEEFCSSKFTLIAGSSWEKEESMIASFLKGNPGKIKVVFAPHDIGESHVSGIENILPTEVTCLRYSQVSKEVNLRELDVMILDNIGLLSNAYQYGKVAFVGGGFTNSLHNILEPATFGLPVFYGNNHPKFPEGEEMAKEGSGFKINRYEEFERNLLRLILAENEWEAMSRKNKEFIESRVGATELVYRSTQES